MMLWKRWPFLVNKIYVKISGGVLEPAKQDLNREICAMKRSENWQILGIFSTFDDQTIHFSFDAWRGNDDFTRTHGSFICAV